MNFLDPKKIANKFVRQCAPPPIRLAGDKSKWKHKRQIRQLSIAVMPFFTPAGTKEANHMPNRPQTRRDELHPPHIARLWCHQQSH